MLLNVKYKLNQVKREPFLRYRSQIAKHHQHHANHQNLVQFVHSDEYYDNLNGKHYERLQLLHHNVMNVKNLNFSRWKYQSIQNLLEKPLFYDYQLPDNINHFR